MSLGGYKRTDTTPVGYDQQPTGRTNIYNQTYIGFVRKSEDEIRMGRLKVWIPDIGGDSDVEESWYTVNYCSPFAGATPIQQFDPPAKGRDSAWSGGVKKDGKTYTESQTSYGFWMVPPDIDNEVIIQFINGDPNKGIWIGCLYKQYMNHMVPGIPRNNAFEPGESGELPPTGEYNKWSDIGNNDDPTRPRYDPLHYGLKMQGLYTDPQRGPASSGARRESPSKVFGFLTPDGSQIYADDLECNQFIRLRTKSGVQLLIHETDGYIYMNSKKGNSWLQISDDGIDMYSTKAVNMHSVNGYNFHTDKDYNLHIGGNYNVFVEGNTKISSVGSTDMLVGKDFRHDVGGAFHSTIKKNRTVEIDGSDHVRVKGNQTVRSDKVLTLQGRQLIVMKTPMVTQNNTPEASNPDNPANAEGAEPTDMKDRKLQETYPDDERKSVTQRLPTHEPFDEHPDSGLDSEGDPALKQDAVKNGNGGVTSDENANSTTGAAGDGSKPSTDKAEPGYKDPMVSDVHHRNSDPGAENTSNTTSSAGAKNKPMLDLLGKAEGTDKGDGYNETLGFGRYTNGDVNLTGMTLGEVDSLQTSMLDHPDNNFNSSAVGRYQIVQTTMRGLKTDLGYNDSTVFTPEVQDRMANRLLVQRGLNKWQSGQISDATFMRNLSQEWASLPQSNGQAYYGGQGRVSVPTVTGTLDQIRANPVSFEANDTVPASQTVEDNMSKTIGVIRANGGAGSGIVIDYSGTIITNAHVVGINTAIGTVLDVEIGGTIRRASLQSKSNEKDIAKIRLKDYNDLIPIVNGGELEDGDTIYSYGFAYGETFTKITAKYNGENNRKVQYADPGTETDGLVVSGLSVMHTVDSIGLKPGMSGGPVLDAEGRLIGMNAATVNGRAEGRFIPL